MVRRYTIFISKPYEVKLYLLQQLLAGSQSGEAIGFRQLLYTTFDTVELEIAINYFVCSQSVWFFEAHSHQTKYQDEVSVMKTISASIIQGSAIGPASYVVNM